MFVCLFLRKGIVSVGTDALSLFDGSKVHEVRRPVHFVVEFFGVSQMELVFHGRIVTDAHKVVIPRALSGNHEESEELVGEEHLHPLVMGRQVALGIVAAVGVLFAPFESARSEFVGHQRAGSGGEAARDDHRLLSVPRGVVGHHFGVGGDVLRRELRQLVGLRVHPAERLQILQVLVLRQLIGQVNRLVRAPLRRHHDAADLLHLRIIRRADSVQVSGDLRSQIRNGHELLQHVLGQDVSVARLLDIVRRHVDVVGADVQVGGRNGSDAPLRLGTERLALVVGRRARDDLVSVLVDRPRRRCRQLCLLFRLLLDFGDLLPLRRWSADLHTWIQKQKQKQKQKSRLRWIQRETIHQLKEDR